MFCRSSQYLVICFLGGWLGKIDPPKTLNFRRKNNNYNTRSVKPWTGRIATPVRVPTVLTSGRATSSTTCPARACDTSLVDAPQWAVWGARSPRSDVLAGRAAAVPPTAALAVAASARLLLMFWAHARACHLAKQSGVFVADKYVRNIRVSVR